MTIDSHRRVEVSASQFPHEREGLDLVRTLLPDETPFRAWSNFEFRDTHGRWHEVDLLLLARDGFHLVVLGASITRVARVLNQAAKLVNVEGYPVVSIDAATGGVILDMGLLVEQYGIGG